MNIASARNHKGVQCIGVGENTFETFDSLLESCGRARLEPQERLELLDAVSELECLDKAGVLPEGTKVVGTDSWVITIR